MLLMDSEVRYTLQMTLVTGGDSAFACIIVLHP